MSWRPGGTGLLEITDGTVKRAFRRIASYTFNAATAPTETEQTLDEGESTEIGLPGDGELTFSYQPHPGRKADRVAAAAHAGGTSVTLTHTRGPNLDSKTRKARGEFHEKLSGTDTIALDANGTATCSVDKFGTGSWQIGAALHYSDVLYIIEDIASATSATLSRYGAASTADNVITATPDDTALAAVTAITGWSLVSPAVETTYTGRLTVAGGDEGSGTGQVTATGTLVLSSPRAIKLIAPSQ